MERANRHWRGQVTLTFGFLCRQTQAASCSLFSQSGTLQRPEIKSLSRSAASFICPDSPEASTPANILPGDTETTQHHDLLSYSGQAAGERRCLKTLFCICVCVCVCISPRPSFYGVIMRVFAPASHLCASVSISSSHVLRFPESVWISQFL